METTMNHLTVKMRIKSTYRDMNPKEKQIADYILANIKLVSRSSISDLAHNLGVADSTVYQFTKKLGYDGFKDFKVNLLTEEFDSEISIHEKISEQDSPDAMLQKVFDSSIKALEDTRHIAQGGQFQKAAALMSSADRVWFFGIGGSNAVALPQVSAKSHSLRVCFGLSFAADECGFAHGKGLRVSHFPYRPQQGYAGYRKACEGKRGEAYRPDQLPAFPPGQNGRYRVGIHSGGDYLALGISVQPPVAAVHHGRSFCDDHVPQ